MNDILRNRIVFLCLWVLSLVGISLYGGPISYGIFAMLTFLPVVSLFYVIYVYLSFRIYQVFHANHLVVDQITPFYFTLANEYPIGFCSIKVSFFSTFSRITGLQDDLEYELLPHTDIKKQTDIICRYRGEYEVGIKTIEICDYFRLIRLRFHNKETLKANVKPALVDLGEIYSMNTAKSLPKPVSLNPSEPDVLVRKYIPGDDIRRISWKQSARSGQLLVRNMSDEENEGVSILMETARYSEDQFVYLPVENKILELTLALALYFVKNNIPVNTCYMDDRYREENVSSLNDFDAFYEAMSAVRFNKDNRTELMMESAKGSGALYQSRAIFMILNRWTDHVSELVGLLREKNISIAVYLMDDEGTYTDTGSMPQVEVIRLARDAVLTEVLL